MDRNVHGQRKALGRTIQHAAVQVILRRKGDGMDQRVQPPPAVGDLCEHGLKLPVLRDVERGQDLGAQFLGQGADMRLCLGVQPGDGKIAALGPQRLGAAIGHGLRIGDTDDQSFVTRQ